MLTRERYGFEMDHPHVSLAALHCSCMLAHIRAGFVGEESYSCHPSFCSEHLKEDALADVRCVGSWVPLGTL